MMTAERSDMASKPAPNTGDPRPQMPASFVARRKDFPALQQTVHGKPLVYLDNAATAQKPQEVIDADMRAYSTYCANVHRGVHLLSAQATLAYEAVRGKAQRFINAAQEREVIFTRGTTESINLVAQTYGRKNVGQGDEIIITALEHHSNIVPWQMLCEERGAKLRVVPMDRTGDVQLDEYKKLLSARTKIVAIAHVSNAIGTVVPVREMSELAHAQGAVVVVDGAQAVPHMPVDVQALGCDFYAFSAHKIFGPTGVGVLWGRAGLLEAMPPWQGGGDMIASVTFEKTVYNVIPQKFEAGTPNIAGVIAMGAAIDYMAKLNWAELAAYETALVRYAQTQLQSVPGIRFIGTSVHKVGVVSFVMDCAHPHDIGTILDHEGVAIRTGHHCAQPVMRFYDEPATARASFAFYNTPEEVDVLVAALKKVCTVFGATS